MENIYFCFRVNLWRCEEEIIIEVNVKFMAKSWLNVFTARSKNNLNLKFEGRTLIEFLMEFIFVGMIVKFVTNNVHYNPTKMVNFYQYEWFFYFLSAKDIDL